MSGDERISGRPDISATEFKAPGNALGAFIVGLRGRALRRIEAQFLRDARPCGIILFHRNCDEPEQIARLVAEVKDAIGSDIFVLIDQEGGRVQRLKPPKWRAMPPARAYGALRETNPDLARRAVFAGSRLIAAELRALGINVDCAPVLDVPVEGAHDIIGDRAYGTIAEEVIALARPAADGFLAGGVLPVIKHIPGHGRAGADSHVSLPVVDADPAELDETDFRPFRELADLPLAMTAHVLIPAFDPDEPVSTSKAIIDQVIRRKIGFDGLLMSDDLSMGALSGDIQDRARAVLAAGCDVSLHCNGRLDEMEKIAEVTPRLAGDAMARFERGWSMLQAPKDFDEDEALALVAEAAKFSAASARGAGVIGEA